MDDGLCLIRRWPGDLVGFSGDDLSKTGWRWFLQPFQRITQAMSKKFGQVVFDAETFIYFLRWCRKEGVPVPWIFRLERRKSVCGQEKACLLGAIKLRREGWSGLKLMFRAMAKRAEVRRIWHLSPQLVTGGNRRMQYAVVVDGSAST